VVRTSTLQPILDLPQTAITSQTTSKHNLFCRMLPYLVYRCISRPAVSSKVDHQGGQWHFYCAMLSGNTPHAIMTIALAKCSRGDIICMKQRGSGCTRGCIATVPASHLHFLLYDGAFCFGPDDPVNICTQWQALQRQRKDGTPDSCLTAPVQPVPDPAWS
jgi:hypothetical protein